MEESYLLLETLFFIQWHGNFLCGGGEAGASQGGPLHFHVVRSYFYIQSLFLRSFFNPLFQANTRVQTK